MTSLERGYWAVASIVVLALVVWPLLRGSDGFPLSNYPMFSKPREREVTSRHVVGLTPDGRSRPLPPATLGTDEVMQASQTAALATKDPQRAADLCARVADQLVRGGAAFADIATIEVRTDVFDTVAYWEGDHAPRRSRVHARCEVER